MSLYEKLDTHARAEQSGFIWHGQAPTSATSRFLDLRGATCPAASFQAQQLLLWPGPWSQACTPISQEARRPRPKGAWSGSWATGQVHPSTEQAIWGSASKAVSGYPGAGLWYSPASDPCLLFRASDRCLTHDLARCWPHKHKQHLSRGQAAAPWVQGRSP